jgi:cold shock CspA family protein
LVQMCGNLCYQTATRQTGRVNNYPAKHSAYGFIAPDDGSDPVFFHEESVYGTKPAVGDPVWFACFPGDPRERAHPVVRLNP